MATPFENAVAEIRKLSSTLSGMDVQTTKVALAEIADFLEDVGWCEQHGKPHLIVQKTGCEDCGDFNEVEKAYEQEHGPDAD